MTILSGHGPGKPTVTDPDSAGELDKMTFRHPFQSQPFCDSVISCVMS